MKKNPLAELGGTFITDCAYHDGSCNASYRFIPEVAEEDERVRTVGRFRTHRWFTGRPVVQPSNGHAVAGVPRTVQCWNMPGAPWVDQEELCIGDPPDMVELCDARPSERCDPLPFLVQLLELSPRRIWEIFDRARKANDQRVLGALPDALESLCDETKGKLRQQVMSFPKGKLVAKMQAALA